MSEQYEVLSERLAGLVESVGPSLVSIEGGRWRSTGTVWSAAGLVVAADHAIGSNDAVAVRLPAGEEVEARVLGRDPGTDLALLRVEQGGLTAPSWGEPTDLKVGHLVLTLGHPGQTVRATLGMVSALNRKGWRTHGGGQVDVYLEVDGRLPRGFSGGALVSLAGTVLGINTHALMRGGITVPTSTVRRVVEALETHGGVGRGYLGVMVHPVKLPAERATEVGQEFGLLVSSVEPGGPAEKAGVLLGDALLTLGEERLEGTDTLLAALSGRTGQDVQVKLLRAGRIESVKAFIGERKGD